MQQALERIAHLLDEKGIPCAVIGAMALDEWGYRRVTVDVDVLLTAEGLRALKEEVLGRGYTENLPGSRGLRDTVAGVNIDVVRVPRGRQAQAGLVPRSGQDRGERPTLPTLVELKLASGMSAPHRLKDLADVLELVRALSLPRDLAASLDGSVRVNVGGRPGPRAGVSCPLADPVHASGLLP